MVAPTLEWSRRPLTAVGSKRPDAHVRRGQRDSMTRAAARATAAMEPEPLLFGAG